VLAKGVEMPVNLHVHEFAQIRGNPQPMVVKETHYMRLKGEGAEFPLYLQNGQVWSDNDGPIALEDWPDWLLAEIERCSPAALAAVGWTRPQGVEPSRPAPKPTARPKPARRKPLSAAQRQAKRERARRYYARKQARRRMPNTEGPEHAPE
jgi:hypothetical protein